MTASTGLIDSGEEQQQQQQHQVNDNHHLKPLNGIAMNNKKSLNQPNGAINGTQVAHQHQNQNQNQRQQQHQLSGSRVGVALIGLGRMGLIHLDNLLQQLDAKLLYCFDTDTLGLRRRYPSCVHFEELGVQLLHCDHFQAALDDQQVEAVIIATPTKFHEHYIRRALEAGKNVLCEKPLTSRTESILPLYELAEQKRIGLVCAFNRRYDPDFRNIRQRTVDRERSGDIQMIKITSRDPSLPPLAYLKLSGGLLHDSVVHDLDMGMWLMRQLPTRIQVTGKTFDQYFRQNREAYLALSAEDRSIADSLEDFFLVLVTLTFPDGGLVVIDNARQSNYGYDQRIEVCCSKTVLKLDGKRALDVVELRGEGHSNGPIHDNFAARYQVAYANELRDLIKMTKLGRLGLQADRQAQRQDLLEPNRPMLVYAVHRTADAGLESWRSGGRPVELEWTAEVRSQFELDIAA